MAHVRLISKIALDSQPKYAGIRISCTVDLLSMRERKWIMRILCRVVVLDYFFAFFSLSAALAPSLQRRGGSQACLHYDKRGEGRKEGKTDRTAGCCTAISGHWRLPVSSVPPLGVHACSGDSLLFAFLARSLAPARFISRTATGKLARKYSRKKERKKADLNTSFKGQQWYVGGQ